MYRYQRDLSFCDDPVAELTPFPVLSRTNVPTVVALLRSLASYSSIFRNSCPRALLYTTTRHNVFDMDEAMSEKAAEIFSAEKEVKAEKVEMWKNMTEDAQPQPAISPVPGRSL